MEPLSKDEKILLLEEQIRLMKEIEKLRAEVAKKPWPNRVAGTDISVFSPGCFS